jgi:eukaryotic-like serine/threonine-protein kinase
MNDRLNREQTIFHAALQLAPDKRAAYLALACEGDDALRRRIQILLEAQVEADPFFCKDPLRVALGEDPGEQATVATITEKPGDRIGRYKLLQQIGEGGCGVVYMAEQEEPVRRRVALKVIKLGMDTRSVIARFEAERQALALMDHPNIAKVFDAGATETGRPYFVMELVRGIKITDYCDQNNLSTRARLDLFIQVCHALQHAHQKGIIHRDIKPSNILVSQHEGVAVPVVIDFGIAKATAQQRLTDKTLFTAFEQFIGTPAYMSPEQAELSRFDIDTRSDIYALGVLLYELLTGKTPFDPKTLLAAGLDEMRRIIREEEPVRPSTRMTQDLVAADVSPRKSTGVLAVGSEADVSADSRRRLRLKEQVRLVQGDLDWIVMKCLEKDRTRRYETANGLALDVERHLNHEPVVARPPSTAYRIQKFVRRNRVMVMAGGAVAAALVLGMVVSTWQAVRATRAERDQGRLRANAEANEQKALQAQANEAKHRRAAEIQELHARQQAYAADINLAQQALAANDLGRAKTLLDSHRPRPGEPDLRGWEWRYLWRECRSDALGELCQLSNSVCRVAYAPDGKTLALAGYMDQGEFVELWDVAGRRRIAALQTNAGHRVAFSPRGDLLATDTPAGINVWRAGTSNLVRQIPNRDRIKALKFSADGTRLASLDQAGEIEVRDVDRWDVICQVPGPAGGDENCGDLDFSPDGKALVVGQRDGRLWVIDLNSGSIRLEISAHPEAIMAVAWSPKASLLASGSGYSGGPVRLWDADSGRSFGTLEGHTSWICQLIFSADGRRLYSASADQTIRIWDVQEQRCLTTLRGHSDEVYGLALSPDGTTLASGSKDGVVAFWSALRQPEEQQPRRLSMQGCRAAFAPDGRTLAVPRDGTVQLYELPGLKQTESLPALGTNALAVAYSTDGALIASGSSNGWLRVWSGGERRLLGEWRGHEGAVGGLRFVSGDTRLISVGYSTAHGGGELIIWDVPTWQRISSLVIKNAGLLSVSPDGRLALGGDEAGQLSWWNVASGERLTARPGHAKRVTGGTFSPDGAQAASVGEDARVVLWDTSSFSQVSAFKGHMNGLSGVAFSPDGRRLTTGAGGRDAIKLWDMSTRRELATLPSEGTFFSFVAFSPDGNWLAAKSWEGHLHLWHAPSLAQIEAVEKGEATVEP